MNIELNKEEKKQLMYILDEFVAGHFDNSDCENEVELSEKIIKAIKYWFNFKVIIK